MRVCSPSIMCALPCSDRQFVGTVWNPRNRCVLLPKHLLQFDMRLCVQHLQFGKLSPPAYPSKHFLSGKKPNAFVFFGTSKLLARYPSCEVQHSLTISVIMLNDRKYTVPAGELVAERERNRPAAKPNSADPRSPHRPHNSPYKGQIAVCLSPSAARSKAKTSAATSAAAAGTLDNPQRSAADVSAVHPVARTTASMQRVCDVAKYAPALECGHRSAQTYPLHAAWCQSYTYNTVQSCTTLQHTTLQ